MVSIAYASRKGWEKTVMDRPRYSDYAEKELYSQCMNFRNAAKPGFSMSSANASCVLT